MAVLAVVLPAVVGLVIIALGHFFGHEKSSGSGRSTESTTTSRQTATATAEAGTPAPRVRLTEGGSGKSFGSDSLGHTPYAVIFISTSCGSTIGGYLASAVDELRRHGTDAAVLAISADPGVDTPKAVSTWLVENHLGSGGPFHYLIGSESELHGYWNAWGTVEGAAGCVGTVPAHLVNGAGENDGVVDLDPEGESSLLTDALNGLSK